MDTATAPAAGGLPALHGTDDISVKTAAQPNVIQAYKGIVKGMVGLMLRLSHEGPSPALIEELEGAASSLVQLMASKHTPVEQTLRLCSAC